MARYKVKHTSILHNGKLYPEGKVINLKEEDVLRLADFVELIPETTQNNSNSNSNSKQSQTNGTVTKTANTESTNSNSGGKQDGE